MRKEVAVEILPDLVHVAAKAVIFSSSKIKKKVQKGVKRNKKQKENNIAFKEQGSSQKGISWPD